MLHIELSTCDTTVWRHVTEQILATVEPCQDKLVVSQVQCVAEGLHSELSKRMFSSGWCHATNSTVQLFVTFAPYCWWIKYNVLELLTRLSCHLALHTHSFFATREVFFLLNVKNSCEWCSVSIIEYKCWYFRYYDTHKTYCVVYLVKNKSTFSVVSSVASFKINT